jgi:hypothetical protein
VNRIATGLDVHIDARATCQTFLRVITIGGDTDRVDGIEAWVVSRDMGSHTLMAEAPSMRILFAFPKAPFVLKNNPRPGLALSECMLTGGLIPGTRTNALW